MPRSLALVALLLLVLAQVSPIHAQTKPLDADQAFRLTEDPQPDGSRLFRFDIAPGYYLYRENFRARAAEGQEQPLETPPGEVKEDQNFGRVEVYHGSVTVGLTGPGPEVTLTWQGCKEDSICYPPQSRVVAASTDGTGLASTDDAAAVAAKAPTLTLAAEPGLIDGLARRGGTVLVLAGFLGFGLLLAFTPCVFPMIPIVAGMVAGGTPRPSARRGLVLSGVYVLAMASAFAALGGLAAWSGQNLQLALQSPVVLMLGAGVFGVLALASFGWFELALPQSLTAGLGQVTGRRGSLSGAAVLGFTSALIVGPCVTAPLAGALIYIAQTGDVVLGAAALFALGLGQGLPLLAVGAFGPQILPRAGAWMGAVRTVFGVMFLGLAIWLLARVLPGQAVLALWAALLIGSGGALWQRGWAPAGAVLALAGALQGVGAGLGGGDPLAPLEPLLRQASVDAPQQSAAFRTVTTSAALDGALSESEGPALVYVTADWCAICRSIGRGPLADPIVTAALGPLTRIKADVSDFGTESQALLDRLGSVGPPTMVFLDSARTEAPGTRLIGAVDSPMMLRSIDGVAR
ncbi:protein-disulfide reductase DsbD [Rhodobacteraceae bacterium HSP-20]|uniref:Protein-disulfide reductase DsbD n=1 Tax=Paragemmobacter amnigenus TaxID=2852097 RepID=A0ABS6J6I9_9RHOB|nr:protein-disulfide reductase DsbD [Rhodobacter amnigenus]MBU9698851.1 protein-disulfide reductase DsbD [Rhodobacter amnigenus]MBV4390078.1 protein-disulfide reductase DsbD [Rhodobacter amnigenus]